MSKSTDEKATTEEPKKPESAKEDTPTDHGKAWDINESPPDQAESDDDGLHSRSGGEQEGEAWTINENTEE